MANKVLKWKDGDDFGMYMSDKYPKSGQKPAEQPKKKTVKKTVKAKKTGK